MTRLQVQLRVIKDETEKGNQGYKEIVQTVSHIAVIYMYVLVQFAVNLCFLIGVVWFSVLHN